MMKCPERGDYACLNTSQLLVKFAECYFPVYKKQQRSLDPQDQTQKLHHLYESDLQMWNRSKLNCKSVRYLWLLSCQIEINITFTNTFCIVLQK